MNLSIRALTIADIGAADQILGAAFRTADSRRPELQRYLGLQPEGWFVAEADGKLVGTVGAVDFGTFAYLGLMAVDPAMQRRGIARALMQHVLARLDARNCPSVLLDASVYGAPLYRSLGFVDEGQVHVYENNTPQRFPNLPAGVTRLVENDLPSLVAFDTPIFGTARRNVLRAYLTDLPDRAFIMRSASGRITGFVFAQPSRIGPWVAENSDDAEKLLRAALSVDCDPIVRVLVPSPNPAAVDLLARYGFRFARSQTHMRRGEKYPTRQRELIFGQASFAIG